MGPVADPTDESMREQISQEIDADDNDDIEEVNNADPSGEYLSESSYSYIYPNQDQPRRKRKRRNPRRKESNNPILREYHSQRYILMETIPRGRSNRTRTSKRSHLTVLIWSNSDIIPQNPL